jgi:hypothetical protein
VSPTNRSTQRSNQCGHLPWTWDRFFCFRAIQIDFFGAKRSDRVFRVDRYRDDPFSSEDNTLNRLFADISANFFSESTQSFPKERKAGSGPLKGLRNSSKSWPDPAPTFGLAT